MARRLFAAALLGLALCVPPVNAAADGAHTLTVAGVERSYLLHRPPQWHASKRMPLVIALVFLHKLLSERTRFLRAIRFGLPVFAVAALIAFLPMGLPTYRDHPLRDVGEAGLELPPEPETTGSDAGAPAGEPAAPEAAPVGDAAFERLLQRARQALDVRARRVADMLGADAIVLDDRRAQRVRPPVYVGVLLAIVARDALDASPGEDACLLGDFVRRPAVHAAAEAHVSIVTGDTKVVPRGMCDKMYICTTGIGLMDDRSDMSPSALRPAPAPTVRRRAGGRSGRRPQRRTR